MSRGGTLLPAVTVASAALTFVMWSWHFLVLERTGDLDTAGGHEMRRVALPSNGEAVSQAFVSPRGGAGKACIMLNSTHVDPVPVVVQAHSTESERPGAVLARRAAAVQGMTQPVCLSLEGVARDAGRLWVSVRLTSGGGHEVFAHATLDDAYPDGQLFVGEREVWGDLAIRVTAPASTRWLQPDTWPPGVPRVTTSLGLVLLLTTSSAVAAGLVLAVASTASTRRGRVATIAGGVMIGLSVRVLSVAPEPPRPRRPAVEGRTLIDDLWAADMRTSWPRLGQALAVEESRIGGAAVRVLLALPSTEVRWSVDVDVPLSLDTGVTLREEAWTLPGDGVGFTIAAEADGATQVLWSAHVDPFFDPTARAWRDVTVRLDRYVGRSIVLVFRTDPGPQGNAVRDAAMWREPVVRPSRPSGTR